jgi:parallel beta-helix repeat protein
VQIGRVLYVSPEGNVRNDGLSESKPKSTIQDALNLLKEGDTVLVKKGTYSNSVLGSTVANISKSGAADAWIALMAYPGHEPLIKCDGNWVGIKVDGASYIIIEGFTLEGNLDRLNSLKPGDENYPYEQANNGSNPVTSGAGIVVAPPYKQYTKQPHHVIVRNNEVRKFPSSGIEFLNADYITVEYNLVYSTSYYSPYNTSGINIGKAFNSDRVTGYKNFIRRNIVSDVRNKIPFIFYNGDPTKDEPATRRITDGNGIILDDFRQTQNFEDDDGNPSNPNFGDPYVGRTLVENNISYNNGARGIHAYSSNHIDIINNTVYHNSFQQETPDGDVTAFDASDVRILNNIIVPLPDRKGINRGSSKPADLATHVIQRNLIFGGLPFEADASQQIIGQDPRLGYPSAYDFRPANDSPAIDAGDSSLAPKIDIFGTSRPLGAGVDLGAIEVR